jgi:uncharacterized protein (TIGR00369 family)
VKSIDAFRKMIAGELAGPPVAELLDMRMVEIEEGRAVFVLGGILCDVADAAMGCAHASLLDDGETFATLELKINFLKPVWEGQLTAVGTVVKAGRTIGLVECRVTDAGGSLVAFATSTCMTLRGEAAVGR